MPNFQKWLREKEISQLTSGMDISFGKIKEDNLIIDGDEFPNLEKLISLNGKNKLENITLCNLPRLIKFELWSCQIRSIEITNCPNLAYLDVRNNLLTSLDFINCLKGQLTHLDISNNNLNYDLSFLKDFGSLKSLFIGNRINVNFVEFIKNDWLSLLSGFFKVFRKHEWFRGSRYF